MKSGKTIVVKFDKFEISPLTRDGHRDVTYNNPDRVFAIDLDAVEFVSIKKTFYGQLFYKH